MKRLLWIGLVVLLAGSACQEPAEEPLPEPVVAPPGPEVGESVELTVEVLSDWAPTQVAVLSPSQLLLNGGGELVRLSLGSSPEPELISDELGELAGVGLWSEGTILLSTEAGLYVLGDQGLELSPLAGAVEPLGPARLLVPRSRRGTAVWLLPDEGLYLWRDGELLEVSMKALPEGRLQAATGGQLDGEEALWVGSEDALVALVEREGSVDGFAIADEGPIDGLAVDGYDHCWMVREGAIQRRDVEGRWWDGALPAPVTGVHSNSVTAWSWWETAENLWLHEADRFHLAIEAPVGTVLAVDGVGRALLATDEALVRLSTGFPVEFHGIADGAELTLVTSVDVLPTDPSAVASVVVSLDGLDQEMEDWTVLLDPLLIKDGVHELVATVEYVSGETATGSRAFVVGEFVPATWSEDIRPIYEAHCSICHSGVGTSAAGGGHPLDTAASWQAEVVAILDNVADGRMPLNNPALSAAQIQAIRSWRAGGFPD